MMERKQHDSSLLLRHVAYCELKRKGHKEKHPTNTTTTTAPATQI